MSPFFSNESLGILDSKADLSWMSPESINITFTNILINHHQQSPCFNGI